VRRAARRLGNRAQRHRLLRRKEVERALEAGGHARVDGAHVALEALGAAVHERDHRRQVWHTLTRLAGLVPHERAHHGIEPPPRLDRVEPHDDDLEATVPFGVLLLDWAVVRRDRHALDSLHHKLGRYCCLRPAHVRVAEEELPIEVGYIDGVHIDDVDLAETHQRKVLEQLAAQAARANHEHSRHVTDELHDLGHRLEDNWRVEERAIVALIGERARARREQRHVRPALRAVRVVKCGHIGARFRPVFSVPPRRKRRKQV